jgi:ABC-2 type transport system permease protein
VLGAPGPSARSPRRPLTAGQAFRTLYATFLRSARTPARLVALAAMAGLALLVAALNSIDKDVPALERAMSTANLSLTKLVAIAALVVGSAVLGDLYDNGSIVYVALRPVKRWVIAAAAWAATVTLVLPAALLAGIAIGIVHTGDGALGAALLASVVGTVAYSALFGLFGVLVKRALPAGLAYLLLWEGFVSNAGTLGARLTVSGYLRSILARITGFDLDQAPFALATGIVVPLLAAAALIAATGWVLGRRELP